MTGDDLALLARGMAGPIREAIVEALAPALARLDILERRAAENESAIAKMVGGGIRYRGVWTEGTSYEPGDCVTWGGSLFIAREATSLGKPASSLEGGRAWALAVKRGADGRDGKDAAK